MSQIEKGTKLYVVVRADLDPGIQAVQAVHAASHFIFEHYELSKEWNLKSDFIALLSIATENELDELKRKAQEKGILYSVFHEDDLGNQFTAMALEPSNKSKKLCSRLKLAFK